MRRKKYRSGLEKFASREEIFEMTKEMYQSLRVRKLPCHVLQLQMKVCLSACLGYTKHNN